MFLDLWLRNYIEKSLFCLYARGNFVERRLFRLCLELEAHVGLKIDQNHHINGGRTCY